MLDYLKAELLRFRSWAIAYFVLHTTVLGFLSRVMDLAQQPKVIYQAAGGVYLASGLLLGAYQMASYRRPNTWLNLLHRPVGHRRLAAGLMLAAALLLLMGVVIPILLCAAVQAGITPRVVDARHVELAVAGGLLALCGYLAGAFALLAPRRTAVAVGVLLAGLGYSASTGKGALLLQALTALWLAGMVAVSFKPDLAAPVRGPRAVLVALPLQLAVWMLMMVLGLTFEIGWLLQGTHPNNQEIPLAGSAKEADLAKAPELMIAGLRGSRAAEAALWREQAAISDVYTVEPNLAELPVRGQLTNPAPLAFEDDTRRARWIFSHDRMRFQGYSLASQRSIGSLGLDGGRPLSQPLLPVDKNLLASRDGLYQFDEESGHLLRRVAVPAGEEVIGLGDVADRLAVTTRRALYLYDRRDLRDTATPLVLRLRVPMPGRAGNLTRVDAMELVDGLLVSFTFTRGPYDGHGTAFQEILRTDEQGRLTSVARRELLSGYPPLYVFAHWYTSPVLYGVATHAMQLFAHAPLDQDRAAPPVPTSIRMLAVALCIVSLLAALWRTRRVDLPLAGRIAWVTTCGVVGLPGLVSLWLMYPLAERAVRVPAHATATA